ncbi:MAG TPA: hypothetical protein VMG10_04780 [Gemmataceae bacterium]|nr:hypothetical protein [Gemmataceae bacterium]
MEISVPYEVSCRCGRPLRGGRQRTRQIVSCPSCGRKRFILPSSCWSAPVAAGKQASFLNLRCLLLAIVLGGALAMGLSFLLVRPYLRRSGTPADTVSAKDARALLEAGENQLREGNVHLALKQLNAAVAQSTRHPDALNREDHRRLEQLRRQTDLLSRLLDQPLEEIVRQAMQHRSDEEWREKLADYRGRSVVFDDVLRRDAQGRPVLGFYVVQVGDVAARVALEDLALLRQLPLDPPRRWLFGARLDGCRREEGGIWVLRFEPDSAVLLTDENAAAACCPRPLERELLGVLKRQDDWLRH